MMAYTTHMEHLFRIASYLIICRYKHTVRPSSSLYYSDRIYLFIQLKWTHNNNNNKSNSAKQAGHTRDEQWSIISIDVKLEEDFDSFNVQGAYMRATHIKCVMIFCLLFIGIFFFSFFASIVRFCNWLFIKYTYRRWTDLNNTYT